MPKTTKTDLERELEQTKEILERELKEAKRILKNITDCFERDDDDCGYNKLVLRGMSTTDLDCWLDEARAFLK